MVLNYIFIAFFVIGFIVALIKMLFLGDTEIFSTMINSMFDSAKTGFEISLGLTGMMALWLGLMKIGEGAGMVKQFSKAVQPVFTRIFKGVPKDHPAHGSIAMNFSANMLGLDNAATPLGLKAMDDLQSLNPNPKVATDAQIMFLVLNTAGMTIIPTSIIAIRQTMAIKEGIEGFNGADIFLPILITTFISFVIAMFTAAAVQKINVWNKAIISFVLIFSIIIGGLSYWLQGMEEEQMNQTIGIIGSVSIMAIVMSFIIAGLVKKVNVYDLFIQGATEGFKVAVSIIPYLIAMLIAISVFRASGSMDFLLWGIASIFQALGWNTDFVPTLPVAIMKPLSGSGARGLMVDVMQEYGVNSFQGKLASIMQGSTETTLFVLAVYFGSVKITNTRNAVLLGLFADLVAIVVAILLAYLFYY